MRAGLLILSLLIFWCKDAQSAGLKKIDDFNDILLNGDSDALKNVLLLRTTNGGSTLWSAISNSIHNAWESIKNIAQITKEKIINWVKHLKEHADDTIKKFKEHLKQIKEKGREIVQQVLGATEILKQCMKKESKNIEDILHQILENVNECIKGNTDKVSLLRGHDANTTNIYDDNIYEQMENKFSICVKKTNNFEQCLKEIYDIMEETENKVLKTNLQAKNVINDILEGIALCSLSGITQASDVIAKETLQIVECVRSNEHSQP